MGKREKGKGKREASRAPTEKEIKKMEQREKRRRGDISDREGNTSSGRNARVSASVGNSQEGKGREFGFEPGWVQCRN